jgi:hypothetical protein
MKISRLITQQTLKEIAANIHELAIVLESTKNAQCLQVATLKTKKVKGRLDLDIAIKFSLTKDGDIEEVNEVLEGLK